MHRRLGILVPFFVVLSMAGCGGSDDPGGPAVIDQTKLEQLVRDKAEEQNGVVKSVTCPENVLAVKDDTITCDFVYEGSATGYADVKVTSDDGDLSLDDKDMTFTIVD